MSIEQHYQNPTSGADAFDTSLTAVRLGDDGIVEDGQLGAVGTSSVAIDDVDGDQIYLPWQRYYLKETDGPSELALTGTVAKSSSSTTITGTGTAFLTEVSPGDELVVPGTADEYLTVLSVTDNTHLEVYAQPDHTATGQTATRAAQQRLFSGWTGPDYVVDDGSGPGGEEFIGPGRVWTLDLAEGNTALHFRIGRSAAWSKTGSIGGATTIGARLVAILAVTEVTGRMYDDGLVDYPTTACDAADLRNQYLDEILNSMAQLSGRNFSLDYHEATGHWQLIFGQPTAFMLPSPLQLSSYAADDATALTYHPYPVKLNGAGGGIFAGIQVVGARRSAYRTDATVADTYEFRDVNASDSSLKTLAKVQAYGDRQLADGASPDEKITCTVVLPASKVHLVRRLREIRVRFRGRPNWDDWLWARILRRELRHATADNGEPIPDHYEVALVLSRPTGAAPSYTYTFGVIDRNGIPEAESESVGTFLMGSSGTGDVPPVGSSYPSQPKVGLIDYVYAGAGPISGQATGFQFGGAGTLTIDCSVHAEFAFDFGSPGGTTVQLFAKIGGVTVASSSIATDPGSGLHSFNPTLVISDSITVASGDILELYYAIGAPAPHIASVQSAGIFAPPYQLVVEGSLAA